MKVVVNETSPTQRTLEVTLEEDRVENAFQKAFGKAAKGLSLPGFRRGKVPMHMAKRYITDDGLSSHVVEDLVPQAYQEALVQEQLNPISEPRWELVQRERGKEFVFKVSFEVKPHIDIKDYKGIELRHEKTEFDPTAVDNTLQELRGGQARLVPAPEDHALVESDLAVVDYQSYDGDQEVEGGSAEKYLMEVKRENFIPGFVDHLTGMKAGDSKEFDIDFPADYPNAALAGKNIHFKFHVHELKLRELPELDDEFAKSISTFETLEDLKKNIQERMEANLDRRLREQVAVKMIDGLLSQVSPEQVPGAMHQYRTRVELQRRLAELQQAGVSVERYLEDRKITQEKWMMELSVLGQLESRVELLVDSIARQEGIKVPQSELDQIVMNEAAQRGLPFNELKAQVEREGAMDMIRYSLTRAKVMDFLFDSGKVDYVAPGTLAKEAAEAAPAAEGEDAPAKPKKAKKAEKPAEDEKAESAEKKDEAGEEEPKPAKAKRASKKKTAEE